MQHVTQWEIILKKEQRQEFRVVESLKENLHLRVILMILSSLILGIHPLLIPHIKISHMDQKQKNCDKKLS